MGKRSNGMSRFDRPCGLWHATCCLHFFIMVRRLVSLLLSVLLVPALTGFGTPLCAPTAEAPMAQAGAIAIQATMHQSSGPAHGTPMEHQHRGGTQTPCDGSMSTNCCPAMAGCAATAVLPKAVAHVTVSPPVAGALSTVAAELPAALSFPPEPPPPRA